MLNIANFAFEAILKESYKKKCPFKSILKIISETNLVQISMIMLFISDICKRPPYWFIYFPRKDCSYHYANTTRVKHPLLFCKHRNYPSYSEYEQFWRKIWPWQSVNCLITSVGEPVPSWVIHNHYCLFVTVGCTDITIGVVDSNTGSGHWCLYVCSVFSSCLIVPCDFIHSILYHPHKYVPIDARGMYAKWFPVSCFYKFWLYCYPLEDLSSWWVVSFSVHGSNPYQQ